MAPYQFIERPTPFSSKAGSTLPVFAVTPAHIEQGAMELSCPVNIRYRQYNTM